MAGAGTTTQVGGLDSGGSAGGLLAANNLSDVLSAATSRANLGFSALTDYVTLTGTQTLTNKTLTSPTVTSLTGTGTTTITGATAINPTGVSSFTVGSSAGSTAIDFISRQSPTSSVYTTSTNAVIEDFALYTKSSSGTPAAGYGGRLSFYADTNGSTNRNSGYLGLAWSTATDASRTAYAEFRLVNNASLIQTVDIVPGGLNIYGTTNGVVSVRTAAATGTWTLTLPTTNGNANEYWQTDGNGVSAWAPVTDALLSTSDVTTNNVSTSKHGFAPKAPNDATKYLDGTGAWSVPAGGGGGKTVSLVRSINESPISTGVYSKTTTSTAVNIVALTGSTNVVTYNGATAATVAHGAASPWTILGRSGGTVIIGSGGTTSRRSTNDGATWANVTNASSNNWTQIGVGGANGSSTVWVMGASAPTTNLGQRSADDGATWSAVSVSGTSIGTRGIASDGGTSGATEWLAVMTNTTTRKSTDNGATWAAGNALTNNAAGIAYLNGRFVAWDTSNLIYYATTTGTAWTVIRSPFPSVLAAAIMSMAYFNSRYYIVGLNGDVYYCTEITATDPSWIKEFGLGSPLPTIGNLEYFGSNIYYSNAQGVLIKIA